MTKSTLDIKLGSPVDMFSEQTINGQGYYDYYCDIAREMWVAKQQTYMKDNRVFSLTMVDPKEDNTNVIRTTFGNLSCHDII